MSHMISTAEKSALPRPVDPSSRSVAGWLRRNLFSSWLSAVITIVMILLLGKLAWWFVDWAVLRAVWSVPSAPSPDTQACRTADAGACWALIREKYRFILFGLYPHAEQWRAALSVLIFISLYPLSADRRLWGWKLVMLWVAGLVTVFVLLYGGVLGLVYVPEDQWGGLPVTLMLATFGIACALPLAVVVALGRSSSNPTVRTMCVIYVELIRGIPLISVLFMASVMFPLFLPDGMNFSKLLRAQVGIVLFMGAYLSETIRGGLQAVPTGQSEAAQSLGLGYWKTMYFVVMPQALTLVLPPIISLCIGLFKSTSLVMIIGIFDLLNAGKRAIAEPAWQGFGAEAYIFVGAIYFAFCFSMARFGAGLEKRLRRDR
jgi:general L-amino acid transport system permease protein